MHALAARAAARLARTPARGDALLAAALLAPALVQVALAPIAPRGVALAIALLTIVPVVWRRSHPVEAALVSTAASVIPSDGYVYVGYAAGFVVFYSLGVYVPDRRVVAATVIAGIAISLVSLLVHDAVLGEYFGALSFVVGPAVVGRFVRAHRQQARRLEELTRHLEHERERGVANALAQERTRIARELHDVVAHGVSVIAIHADAAEAALDRDPELARAPLRTIRSSATEALAEMRRLLGVLREREEGAESAPLPGLAQLPALLERARAAGIDVRYEPAGEPRPLPASLDLSAYRIVQEALTNVHRHAGDAPTTVRCAWRADALKLEIRDAGPGAPAAAGGDGGHGLVGMRERARLHGGTLDAGPAPAGGGFRVHALLPLEGT